MYLKITPILISSLLICSTTFAQTTTSTTGKFAMVKKGQAVPFDGTLFDPVATAHIIAEKRYQAQKCQNDKKYATAVVQATCDRDLKYLKYKKMHQKTNVSHGLKRR